MTDRIPRIIFLVSTILCTILRVYLKLVVIDPATGFYEGGGILPTLFHALLAISVVLLLVLGWFSSHKPAVRTLYTSNIARIAAALSALFCLFYAGPFLLQQFSSSSDTAGLGLSVLTGALKLLLQGIVLLLAPLAAAGLWLRIAGKGIREPEQQANAILALSPVIWLLGVLLVCFMQYTAIRSVSDQKLSILVFIAFILAFFYHARWAGGIQRPKGIALLTLYGLPAALLSITTGVGMLAASIAGKGVAVAPSWTGAGFFCFAGLYLASLCLSVQSDYRS